MQPTKQFFTEANLSVSMQAANDRCGSRLQRLLLLTLDKAGVQIIGMLREAAADNRVKGVFASLGANQAFEGLAQVQELRNAVADFRSALLC